MKVSVFNPGLGTHVKQSLIAYNKHAELINFYTSFFIRNNFFGNILTKAFPKLKSRQFDQIPQQKIKSLYFGELLRLGSSKLTNPNTTDAVWEWAEHKFDKWVASQLNSSTQVLHGYEHASLFSFQRATQLNIFKVYEQPSVHHKYFTDEIVQKLFEKEVFFKNNFSALFNSALSRKRNLRRDQELELADVVVCNSTYVKRTLLNAGVQESKIAVIPLGFPPISENSIEEKDSLKFIVSGNLSYLKGVHHVLRVWKKHRNDLKNHQLICIGDDTLDSKEWEGLPNNVIKRDRMERDNYLKELNNADVLILNTYSDGYGMVMSEAMANGLAVIGTENSAAPDIIENGISGFVIPIGSEVKLSEYILWMISNPIELKQMRIVARKSAAKNTWENFSKSLVDKVEENYQNSKLINE